MKDSGYERKEYSGHEVTQSHGWSRMQAPDLPPSTGRASGYKHVARV